jgi:hypothetical protein
MKNSNDTIGNRTPDLPTLPQPTAPPRTAYVLHTLNLTFYPDAHLPLVFVFVGQLKIAGIRAENLPEVITTVLYV